MRSGWHDLMKRRPTWTDDDKVLVAAITRLAVAQKPVRPMCEVYEELLCMFAYQRRWRAEPPISRELFLSEIRKVRVDAAEEDLADMWDRLQTDHESMALFVDAFRLRRMVM